MFMLNHTQMSSFAQLLTLQIQRSKLDDETVVDSTQKPKFGLFLSFANLAPPLILHGQIFFLLNSLFIIHLRSVHFKLKQLERFSSVHHKGGSDFLIFLSQCAEPFL